jgi:hypothetical protein
VILQVAQEDVRHDDRAKRRDVDGRNGGEDMKEQLHRVDPMVTQRSSEAQTQ